MNKDLFTGEQLEYTNWTFPYGTPCPGQVMSDKRTPFEDTGDVSEGVLSFYGVVAISGCNKIGVRASGPMDSESLPFTTPTMPRVLMTSK